ncbi:hypothetical protein QFC19_002709 [Naganishia cerealis]|uniref:Uncharacterized protein n=1 Tax=Naganishia cerealis TaxID=610337 RepID=A0ACC2W9C5_9TREE|nr:hypothetical protein QFC19_002709 [Naganishia cerealis]
MPSHGELRGSPECQGPYSSISPVASQLAVVAITSAVFGYWLATGLRLPYSNKVNTARAEVARSAPTVPAPSGDEPSQKSKKKNKSKEQQNGKRNVSVSTPEEAEVDAGSDSEDEREAVSQASLDQVKAGKWEECKLVLVVNQELGMTKGKIAAQCG